MNTDAIKSLAQSIIDATTSTASNGARSTASASRATRVEMYADWLAHDADGLAFNLANPAGQALPGATAILADAREKVALALSRIDRAIEADRQAHSEQEPA
jgi:hypothetical protein